MQREAIAPDVRRIVAEHLDLDPDTVHEDSRFASDLGGDSLDDVEITLALEDEFGVVINDYDGNDELTLRYWIDDIERALTEEAQ